MHKLPSMYVSRLTDSGPIARVVALGSRQREGLNYDATFAPVVKFASIRVLLATVALMDLQLQQMGVVTAFLHGDIDKEIYMFPPAGNWSIGH